MFSLFEQECVARSELGLVALPLAYADTAVGRGMATKGGGQLAIVR